MVCRIWSYALSAIFAVDFVTFKICISYLITFQRWAKCLHFSWIWLIGILIISHHLSSLAFCRKRSRRSIAFVNEGTKLKRNKFIVHTKQSERMKEANSKRDEENRAEKRAKNEAMSTRYKSLSHRFIMSVENGRDWGDSISRQSICTECLLSSISKIFTV